MLATSNAIHDHSHKDSPYSLLEDVFPTFFDFRPLQNASLRFFKPDILLGKEPLWFYRFTENLVEVFPWTVNNYGTTRLEPLKTLDLSTTSLALLWKRAKAKLVHAEGFIFGDGDNETDALLLASYDAQNHLTGFSIWLPFEEEEPMLVQLQCVLNEQLQDTRILRMPNKEGTTRYVLTAVSTSRIFYWVALPSTANIHELHTAKFQEWKSSPLTGREDLIYSLQVLEYNGMALVIYGFDDGCWSLCHFSTDAELVEPVVNAQQLIGVRTIDRICTKTRSEDESILVLFGCCNIDGTSSVHAARLEIDDGVLKLSDPIEAVLQNIAGGVMSLSLLTGPSLSVDAIVFVVVLVKEDDYGSEHPSRYGRFNFMSFGIKKGIEPVTTSSHCYDIDDHLDPLTFIQETMPVSSLDLKILTLSHSMIYSGLSLRNTWMSTSIPQSRELEFTRWFDILANCPYTAGLLEYLGQQRISMGGSLFFDDFLGELGLDDLTYPPSGWSDLRTIVEAVYSVKSRQTDWPSIVILYLIMEQGENERIGAFARFANLPQTDFSLTKAAWLADHAMFKEATAYFIHAQPSIRYLQRFVRILSAFGQHQLVFQIAQCNELVYRDKDLAELVVDSILCGISVFEAINFMHCVAIGIWADVFKLIIRRSLESPQLKNAFLETQFTTEEAHLLYKFCKQSKTVAAHEFMILYYIYRGRFVDAIHFYDRFTSEIDYPTDSKAASVIDALVRNVKLVLPSVQQKLLESGLLSDDKNTNINYDDDEEISSALTSLAAIITATSPFTKVEAPVLSDSAVPPGSPFVMPPSTPIPTRRPIESMPSSIAGPLLSTPSSTKARIVPTSPCRAATTDNMALIAPKHAASPNPSSSLPIPLSPLKSQKTLVSHTPRHHASIRPSMLSSMVVSRTDQDESSSNVTTPQSANDFSEHVPASAESSAESPKIKSIREKKAEQRDDIAASAMLKRPTIQESKHTKSHGEVRRRLARISLGETLHSSVLTHTKPQSGLGSRRASTTSSSRPALRKSPQKTSATPTRGQSQQHAIAGKTLAKSRSIPREAEHSMPSVSPSNPPASPTRMVTRSMTTPRK